MSERAPIRPAAARGPVPRLRLAVLALAFGAVAIGAAAPRARAVQVPPAAAAATTPPNATTPPAADAAAVATEAAPSAAHAPETHAPGFATEYLKPATADYDLYYEQLRRQHFLESVAQELDRILELPAQLTLRLDECGHSTTHLSRDGRVVIVCYEYVDAVLVIAAGAAPSEARAEQLFSGGVTFALLSEIGQALIGLLELPVAAGPARGGDQFAAIALAAAEKEGDPSAAAAVEFLEIALREPDSGFEYLETHEFGRARLEDVACLLYGNAPGNHAAARASGTLPQSRAPRCAEELVATVRAWDGYLAKYTRPAATAGAAPAVGGPK